MTSFNCACPAIQKGKGSGFLSEGSSWLTACMSEQRRFWRDWMRRLAWTFAARIGDKYQIRLTLSFFFQRLKRGKWTHVVVTTTTYPVACSTPGRNSYSVIQRTRALESGIWAKGMKSFTLDWMNVIANISVRWFCNPTGCKLIHKWQYCPALLCPFQLSY